MDYLREEQKKYERLAEDYRREGNEVMNELARQLILVATVFLTISPLILRSNIVLSTWQKYFLSSFWILLIGSIGFGIKQYFTDYRFFGEWSESYYDIHDEINHITDDRKAKECLTKIVNARQKNLSKESSDFVWYQIITMAFGIILFLSILIVQLFK